MELGRGMGRGPAAHPVVTGAVSGIVAATVMALFVAVVAGAAGRGALAPAQLVGATLLAEAAEQPVLAAIVGVGLHFLMGAFLGALFGAATARVRSRPLLVAAGLAYGAAVFLGMAYLVLPVINPVLATELHAAWFFLYHLAFGLALPASILVARARPARRWFADDQRHSHA